MVRFWHKVLRALGIAPARDVDDDMFLLDYAVFPRLARLEKALAEKTPQSEIQKLAKDLEKAGEALRAWGAVDLQAVFGPRPDELPWCGGDISNDGQ